jgi:hypothetical protein
MHPFSERSTKGVARRKRLLPLAAVATAALPLAAHASVIETFDWVPISEDPTSAQTTTAHGTLQLTLSSWALTGTSDPPNFGPYYASGNDAATVNITGLSYTAANGLTATLSEVTSESVRSTTTPWETSGLVTPAAGGQSPKGTPTQGYYLISGFTVSGKTAQGSPFMIANNLGTAGATFSNGVPNGDATFNAAGSIPAIEDGGYWEFVSATTVPLPPGLALLVSGLGLMFWLMRRDSSLGAARG